MRVAIAGCGGVGWWLTTCLARQVPLGTDLTVWDPDTIEGSGAERLPQGAVFGASYAGMAKADALVDWVRFVGGIRPTTVLIPLEPRHAARYDLVIDCTDMNVVDRAALKAASKQYVRVSYDIADGKAFVVVADHVPFSVDNNGGYVQAPGFAHAVFAGAFGAEVILRRLHGQTVELPQRAEIAFSNAEVVPVGAGPVAELSTVDTELADDNHLAEPEDVDAAGSCPMCNMDHVL